MKKTDITLSIIIPCYNDGAYVTQAVQSAQACDVVSCEVIVVDDGSDDDKTIEVLGLLRDTCRVVRQPHAGPASARNTGVRHARGQYLLFLDADNMIAPSYPKRGIELLKKDPRIAVAYSDISFFGDASHVQRVSDFDALLLMKRNYIDTCAVVKKRAWEDVGGFDEHLDALIWEDWEFWIHIAKKGWEFRHIPHPLFHYRVRRDSREAAVKHSDIRDKATRYIVGKHAEFFHAAYVKMHGVYTSEGDLTRHMVAKIQHVADALFLHNRYIGQGYKKGILILRRLLGTGATHAHDEEFSDLVWQSKNTFQQKVGTQEPPLVSIIIPVRNGYALTMDCLASIAAYADCAYEVIIVDNGSTDKTKHLPGHIQGLRYIRNDCNRGFAAACNQGARMARGTYVLFLNNDTVITRYAVKKLVQALESSSTCGAVGGKLLFPDGALQEAGGIVLQGGRTKRIGRGENPASHAYNTLQEVDYCSGACLLIPKTLFHDIGGFDEGFVLYYEDVDLCMKVKAKGYTVAYQPEAVVYHHENTTTGRWKSLLIQEKSRRMFVRRWKAQIRRSAYITHLLF